MLRNAYLFNTQCSSLNSICITRKENQKSVLMAFTQKFKNWNTVITQMIKKKR